MDDGCSLFLWDGHDIFNIVTPESQVSRLRNRKDKGKEGTEARGGRHRRQAHTRISEVIVL